MAAEPLTLRRSPLAHRRDELAALAARVPGATLHEEPFLTQLNLRVQPGSPAIARIERLLELRLPARPNTVAESADGTRAAVWLGPDEWLIVAPDGAAGELTDLLSVALEYDLGSAVDVSANRTTLRLSGPRAREVLETGCAPDLHPRSFGPGDCAQTMLARAQVVLWQLDERPAYRVLVRSSFAEYLTDWLCAAIRSEGSTR